MFKWSHSPQLKRQRTQELKKGIGILHCHPSPAPWLPLPPFTQPSRAWLSWGAEHNTRHQTDDPGSSSHILFPKGILSCPDTELHPLMNDKDVTQQAGLATNTVQELQPYHSCFTELKCSQKVRTTLAPCFVLQAYRKREEPLCFYLIKQVNSAKNSAKILGIAKDAETQPGKHPQASAVQQLSTYCSATLSVLYIPLWPVSLATQFAGVAIVDWKTVYSAQRQTGYVTQIRQQL